MKTFRKRKVSYNISSEYNETNQQFWKEDAAYTLFFSFYHQKRLAQVERGTLWPMYRNKLRKFLNYPSWLKEVWEVQASKPLPPHFLLNQDLA